MTIGDALTNKELRAIYIRETGNIQATGKQITEWAWLQPGKFLMDLDSNTVHLLDDALRPALQDGYYRVYKEEISPYTTNKGWTLVKHHGCNGVEHRIQHYHLAIDKTTKKVINGKSCVRPDKVLGPCDYVSCRNLGFFTKEQRNENT